MKKIKNNMIFFMPYFLFIVPVLPIINKINIIYIGIIFILALRKIKTNKYSLYFSMFIGIIIIYGFISLIWSENQALGMSIMMSICMGFLVMFSLGFLLDKYNIVNFLKHFSICTNIILLIALYEIFTGNYIFVKNSAFLLRENYFGLSFPLALFANPNDLSYYLLLALPLCTYYHKQKNNKVAIILIYIFIIFCILATESRMALISFIFLIIFNVAHYSVKSSNNILKITIMMIMLFTLGLLYCEIRGINLYMELGLDRLLNININEMYFTGRAELLKSSYLMGMNTFLIGGGIGSITSFLQIPPHSPFALFFADLGILGSGMFLLFWLYGLLHLSKITYMYRRYLMGTVTNSLLGIWVAFPFSSMITSGAEQRKITWLLFGIITVFIKMSYVAEKMNKL